VAIISRVIGSLAHTPSIVGTGVALASGVAAGAVVWFGVALESTVDDVEPAEAVAAGASVGIIRCVAIGVALGEAVLERAAGERVRGAEAQAPASAVASSAAVSETWIGERSIGRRLLALGATLVSWPTRSIWPDPVALTSQA
jgi:hypothetical protein